MKIIVLFLLLILIPSSLALEISFFEEFPNEQTISKAYSLTPDSKIYLGAHNLTEFYFWQEKIQMHRLIYWPTLEEEEGYWISPWANRDALERVFFELRNRDTRKGLTVMLDLEFPKNKWMILTNMDQAIGNKKRIKKFVQDSAKYNINFIGVEKAYISDFTLRVMGLSYPIQRSKMYYTSFKRPLLPDFIVDFLFSMKAKIYARKDISMGIGLIAPGIHGSEPTYAGEILEKELRMAEEAGIKEVIIFRLDGIDDSVLGTLN